MYTATPYKFCLHLHEDVLRDDGLVIVLHVVLRHGAVVPYTLLSEKIRGDGLLQKGIAHIFLVP